MRAVIATFVFAACIGGCSLLVSLDELNGGADAGTDAATSDVMMANDANDASDADAAAAPCDPIEGGAPCTPGRVDCFGYGTCDAGLACCSNFGCISEQGAPSVCVSNGGFVFECDETTDCTASTCCIYRTDAGQLGSSCTDCFLISSMPATACKTNAECLSKQLKCQKVTCDGVQFETCGGKCPQ